MRGVWSGRKTGMLNGNTIPITCTPHPAHTHRSKVGLPGKTEGTIFTPLPCEVVYFEPERVGVEMLQQVKQDSCGTAPVLSDFLRIERWVVLSWTHAQVCV